MSTDAQQRQLSAGAITEFYHDEFVTDQVRDFLHMWDSSCGNGTIVDIGGGCGFFAAAMRRRLPNQVRVVDMDQTSVEACRRVGIDAVCGDALNPAFSGDESVACFNLILHHLVTSSERGTRSLQESAITAWHGRASAVFVNEYIYQSFAGNASGWLIYQITKSKWLSMMARAVSNVVPVLRANTFGVGVRFRSHDEWRTFFQKAGYEVVKIHRGHAERVALPLRLLLIKEIRRDSFWLVSRRSQST
jgi:hypothetical protein